MRPFRASGSKALGIDWETSHCVTIVDESHTPLFIKNPRHLKSKETNLKRAQKNLSRKKKDQRIAKKILANAHKRVAWKREDFLHQTSASIVKYASFIAAESLDIKAMTANGGVFKAGLNRSILDTSHGKFFELLEYKAADAGIVFR